MINPEINKNWPDEAIYLINRQEFQAALKVAIASIKQSPADVVGYEIATFILARIWLFRSANEIIRQGLENVRSQEGYLRYLKSQLETTFLPLHDGLPVLNSDKNCAEWLPESAEGTYSEHQTAGFEENIRSLNSFFDNGQPFESLTNDMKLIVKKMHFMAQQWDFSQAKVVVDLGGFDGILAWFLYKYYPHIEKIFLVDTIFPESAPDFFSKNKIPIEFIQADLFNLDYNKLPDADTFLLIDVAEHIPENVFGKIIEQSIKANQNGQFLLYTPTLNHNNLEQIDSSIRELPIHFFDFWFWMGTTLSPTNINHVPSHLSYKSHGWLYQLFNKNGFHCHSSISLESNKAMNGRLYLSASQSYKENKWNSAGLKKGVMEFII
ncbi:MAG: hypothetical protein DWQ05_09355 [Calditrichaeota bacterium]|nr:MAG: hypothetical protein DWQ05_09355 [Calditrichota bacterium]